LAASAQIPAPEHSSIPRAHPAHRFQSPCSAQRVEDPTSSPASPRSDWTKPPRAARKAQSVDADLAIRHPPPRVGQAPDPRPKDSPPVPLPNSTWAGADLGRMSKLLVRI